MNITSITPIGTKTRKKKKVWMWLLLGGTTLLTLNYQSIITLFQTQEKEWKIGYPNASGISATFDKNNGTLTIVGSGAMQDFHYNHTLLPWYRVKDEITSVDINSGITTIGNNAFLDCISLASVNIPEGITKIGEHSFMACKNLTSIIIPSSVTTIDEWAFYQCTSLTDVTVSWKTPIAIDNNVFGDISLDNVQLYISSGVPRAYAAASVWRNFKQVIIPLNIGTWNLTGRDSYQWSAKLVIQSVYKNMFTGYIDWYKNKSIYCGREYYEGTYDEKTRGVILQGTQLENANGIAIGIYNATLSTSGKELTKGTWGGAGTSSGTWKATFLNK